MSSSRKRAAVSRGILPRQWRSLAPKLISNLFFRAANGFIEGSELDGFLREFVSSVNAADVGPEVMFHQALLVCVSIHSTCFTLLKSTCDVAQIRPDGQSRL